MVDYGGDRTYHSKNSPAHTRFTITKCRFTHFLHPTYTFVQSLKKLQWNFLFHIAQCTFKIISCMNERFVYWNAKRSWSALKLELLIVIHDSYRFKNGSFYRNKPFADENHWNVWIVSHKTKRKCWIMISKLLCLIGRIHKQNENKIEKPTEIRNAR